MADKLTVVKEDVSNKALMNEKLQVLLSMDPDKISIDHESLKHIASHLSINKSMGKCKLVEAIFAKRHVHRFESNQPKSEK
jgi:hypothetical protein